MKELREFDLTSLYSYLKQFLEDTRMNNIHNKLFDNEKENIENKQV